MTLYFREHLRFPQTGSDGIELGYRRDYVRQQNKKSPHLPIFLSVLCVYLHNMRVHTHTHTYIRAHT